MFRSNARGFTLIEVTIVLVVLALLGAILVPSLGGFNSLARKVRLREDLGVLCSTLKMMLDDLGDSAFFGQPTTYGGFAGASMTGFATSSYGAGGGVETIVHRTTELGDTAGIGDWCSDCDMPSADCGEHCMDDCGENCRAQSIHRIASAGTMVTDHHAQQTCIPGRPKHADPVVSTTTLTYETRATGRAGSATSTTVGYRSYGAGYGYGVAGGWWGYPVGLLVGNGEIPGSAIGATEWQLPLGATFTAATGGYYSLSATFGVDTFDNQLIHQDPTWYRGARIGAGFASGYGAFPYAARYGTRGAAQLVNPYYRWRGPYIADAVIPDPWGNRYMANVFALHAPLPVYGAGLAYGAGFTELYNSAVVCYSAGPNETIETHFNQPWGWYTGGDDVTVVLAGAGGIR